MGRIQGFFLGMFLVLIPGLTLVTIWQIPERDGPTPVAEPDLRLDPDRRSREEYGVISSMLDHLDPGAEHYVVYERTTVEPLLEPGWARGWCDRVPSLSPEAASDFELQNAAPCRLHPAFMTRKPVVLITDAELDAIFLGDVHAGWQRYDRAYPKAHGYVVCSRVGFNASLTEAVIVVSHARGWCGTGNDRLYHLERTPAGWRVLRP